MKLKIDKNILYDKLQTASRFTSNRLSSIASLQGVLCEVKNNKLHIYATDLNTFYHATIATDAKENLRIVIEPRKILEYLVLLSGSEVLLDIEESRIVVTQGKTKGTFSLMEAGDFPLPPTLKEKEEKLKTTGLVKHLPLVLFSASRDEARPVLTAVNFLSANGDLTIVSTDGFRLSLVREKSGVKLPSMLLPSDFIQETLRFLKDEKEVGFTFSPTEKIARISISDDEFYTRLVDGEFPPFEKVIPSDRKAQIVLDRDEFLRNTKLVSVFARESSNIVLVGVEDGGISIAPKQEQEKQSGTFQEAQVEGDKMQIAFNCKFLLDFLNNASGKRIIIELLRPDAPAVFKIEGEKDFFHIIMPVRIQA